MPAAKYLGMAGRHVLVTGGTRGIGLAVAKMLAGAGTHVAVASRKQHDCDRAAAELGAGSLGVACDVSDPADVGRLFDAVDAWRNDGWLGLVNAAGYPYDGEIWNASVAQHSAAEAARLATRVAAVDLGGARSCAIELLQRVGDGGGAIVFVSSTPALEGYRGTPYTEAKAALLGLMRELALQSGPNGVRANAVALGNIETAYVRGLDEPTRRALADEAPLRRWGTADEAAGAIVFFLSDLASFVTGQTLVVDGGTVRR